MRRKRQNRAEAEKTRQAREHADEVRGRCETLIGFIEEAWPILEPMEPFVRNWHIDAMAEHIEAVFENQIGNLAMNVPPGFMKSLLVSVFYPAWAWTKRPGMRFVGGSYEQSLARRDSRKMRTLVTSPWYRTLWGETTELLTTGVDEFINASQGVRQAEPFVSLLGKRGDNVLIDDPHSTEKVESDSERQKAVRIFREGIQNRINNPEKSAIILIMQRLHHQDISGAIDDAGMDYERLVLPMEYEPDRHFQTSSIGWRDPRTKPGELLDKKRFTPARVKTMKNDMGSFAWAGQYQQRPVPREGGMFKRDWFNGKILRTAPRCIAIWRHWDLADTDLKRGDMKSARTAGVKMGKAYDGSFVIFDMKAAGIGGAKRRALIETTADLDGHQVKISIPQDPGAAGKTVAREMIAMLAGYDARRLIEGALGNKVQRAEPFAAQCEAGNVYLMEGPWNEEFLDEITQFPGGARKDIVDACSGAFSRMVRKKKPDSSRPGAAIVISAED